MFAYLHFDLGLDLIVGRNGMFVVEVKVHGFATKDSDGRKSYTKGIMIKWDIEFGSLTLELLVSLTSYPQCGSLIKDCMRMSD